MLTHHAELELDGRLYEVMVAGDEVIEGWVRVKAHDKAPTMRRIANQKTLKRLGAALRPKPTTCHACGREIACQ